MKHQEVFITGANCGIGLALAKEMISHGAHVTIACRSNVQETLETLNAHAQKCGHRVRVRVYKVNLADSDSITNLVEQLRSNQHKFSCVCLNAGVTFSSPRLQSNGIDEMLFVNCVANYLLIEALKPLIERGGRIVFTSSDSHRWRDYEPVREHYDYGLLNQVQHYARTKLYNQMVANHYSTTLLGGTHNIYTYAVCPGPVCTNITRNAPLFAQPFVWLIFVIAFQSAQRGAQHIMHACCKPSDKLANGSYFWMSMPAKLSETSLEQRNIEQLIGRLRLWSNSFNSFKK